MIQEKEALKELGNREDLIINRANKKGRATVVQDVTAIYKKQQGS